MNDNLDEWLSSLELPGPTPPAEQQEVSVPDAPIVTHTLSEEDMDDILEELGFPRPDDAQAVEIVEEDEDEEAEENISVIPVSEYENSPQIAAAVEEARNIMDEALTAVLDSPEPPQEEQATVVSELPEATPRIQPNSPTLLIDESTTRFSGAEWFNEIQKKRIVVAGCGGIGSNLAFQLARMHPAGLYLYDDDTVETVNMAGQLFSRNDVGRTKVSAVTGMISAYTNMQSVYAIPQRFTETTEAANIMMCGFDNMAARKTFFEAWKNHVINKPAEEMKYCLFLDGRLSMDTLQVFCITGDDSYNMATYMEHYLFSDEEAEHTVCSMKQTTYLACMIGSVMTNLFTNFCANLLNPIIPYDLPFFTEYDAQNMIFKTEK